MSCGQEDTSSEPTEEEKRLIETLYNTTIADIRELKARQWDVTKWVLAANVALFIPIALDKFDLSNRLLYLVAVLSAALGILAGATILKTQHSLKGNRIRLECWRNRHGDDFKNAREAGVYKTERTGRQGRFSAFLNPSRSSFWCDWLVWLPMLMIAAIASAVTALAALSQPGF